MAEPGETLVHEAARRQGLGEVQRVFRERNPLWTTQTYVIIGVAVVVILVSALPDTRWRWPALLLGPVLAVAVVAGVTFLGRVRFVEHRRLIGVSDLGFLVYTEDHGSFALPYDEIAQVVRNPGREPRHRYVIVEENGDRTELRDVHDGRALVASLEWEKPMRAPVRRRALVGTAVGVVVVLLGWASAQQAFGVAQVFGTPGDLDAYAKVCAEPGSAFRGAAPYAAAAPRPVVIFEGGDGPYFRGSGPWGPTDPGDVQVVMCVRRSGSAQVLKSCKYGATMFGGGESRYLSLVAGKYEVTVYEARTRELIRTRTLTGTGGDCPQVVSRDRDEVYASLEEEQFHESMSDIVGSA